MIIFFSFIVLFTVLLYCFILFVIYLNELYIKFYLNIVSALIFFHFRKVKSIFSKYLHCFLRVFLIILITINIYLLYTIISYYIDYYLSKSFYIIQYRAILNVCFDTLSLFILFSFLLLLLFIDLISLISLCRFIINSFMLDRIIRRAKVYTLSLDISYFSLNCSKFNALRSSAHIIFLSDYILSYYIVIQLSHCITFNATRVIDNIVIRMPILLRILCNYIELFSLRLKTYCIISSCIALYHIYLARSQRLSCSFFHSSSLRNVSSCVCV